MGRQVSSVLLFLALSVSARAEGPAEIVETSGVQGGLVVVIGVDDADTLAAYRANNSYLVHGLDTDSARVAAVRKQLVEKGLYGKVSVDVFDGKTLPYIDRLINLVVSGVRCQVSGEEIERVLAPRGVALIGGRKSVKPVPSEFDDWGHFLYDPAAKNASQDTVAYFPEHLQWEAGPLHDRHHDTVQGIEAIVSCNGRLFYIVDDAPPSVSDVLPDQWRLAARDAFSGVLLWKRDMGEFGWKAWAEKALVGRVNNPKDMQRRVVAVGDHVYATLAYNAPVSELDAATGEVLKTYKGTEATSEILHVAGKLILGIRQDGVGVTAVQPDDGKILWQYDADDGASLLSRENLFLCAGGGGVYFFAGDGITGIDASSGKKLWHTSLEAAAGRRNANRAVGRYAYPSLLYHDGAVVVLKSTGEITALSAKAGNRLWQSKQASLTYGTRGALFVAQNLIWSFGGDLRISPKLVGLDPKTGKVVRTIDCADVKNAVVGHMRCYPAKATEKTFWTTIGGKPQQVVHLDTGENCSMSWLRGGCRVGIVPANGFLYMTPHPCACHAEIMLNGLFAMGPARKDGSPAAPPAARLVKGPAYNVSSSPPSHTPPSTRQAEHSPGRPISAEWRRSLLLRTARSLLPRPGIARCTH
jgi:outer membrane protein assembly factor BamB